MEGSPVRVCVLKLGCIGAASLLEYILDERADRKDIEVMVVSSGSKMDPDAFWSALTTALASKPQLALVVSPNASLSGPTLVRTGLRENGIPAISISDGPSSKAFYKKDSEGKRSVAVGNDEGFIVLSMDPMIGARREFLDPREMVLFNSDILKVLSATGVIRLLQKRIDGVIDSLKEGAKPTLPQLTVTETDVLAEGGFTNKYSSAKAYAALQIAASIGPLISDACFKEKNKSRYTQMVAAAHEVLRAAARLADEAREMQKASRSVSRTPHASSGETLTLE